MNDHPILLGSLFTMAPGTKAVSSNLSAVHDDLEAAHFLQSRHIFPRQLPHVHGLDYYGECRPAGNVGGDFLDFALLPENILTACVGDVSGHGVGAAIMMSGLQAYLRALAVQPGKQITCVVEELNRDVCQAFPDNFYATLFYAQIDVLRRQMHYVSAGHEPALLVCDRLGVINRLDSAGTVLGLTARTTYQQRVLSFEPGDVFVVLQTESPRRPIPKAVSWVKKEWSGSYRTAPEHGPPIWWAGLWKRSTDSQTTQNPLTIGPPSRSDSRIGKRK